MKTRSTSKSDIFLMLNDDRKTSRPQDFDKQKQEVSCIAGSKAEQEMDEYVQQNLCGWACSCAVTRMNFAIGTIALTAILYFLSETTLMFEQIANFFTGIPIPEAKSEEKSIERFLEDHYMQLCLIGPCLIVIIALNFYLNKFSGKLSSVTECSRAKSMVSSRRCCRRETETKTTKKAKTARLNTIKEEPEEEED